MFTGNSLQDAIIYDNVRFVYPEGARMYRKMQPWPSKVVKGDDWDKLYVAGNSKQSATRQLDAAIEWANGLIDRISAGNT